MAVHSRSASVAGPGDGRGALMSTAGSSQEVMVQESLPSKTLAWLEEGLYEMGNKGAPAGRVHGPKGLMYNWWWLG